jgi:hypothetical protein
MSGVLDVLGALRGERLRDGSWKIELGDLRLTSVFGGTLNGSASLTLNGDSALFSAPPELAACGKMWMPDVSDVDAFRNAIVEAHGQVRERASEGISSLRRLGFKAKLTAPEPRARAQLAIDGKDVVVGLDQNGDLIVELVAGRPVPVEQRRALIAPDEATAEEALRRVTALVQGFAKKNNSKPPQPTQAAPVPGLSNEELRELQAALSDDEDPLIDSDEGSEEAEPTAAGVEMPLPPARKDDLSDEGTQQVPVMRVAKATARDDIDDDLDDDVPGTVEVRLPGSRSLQVDAQLAALEQRDERERERQKRGDSLLDAFDDDDEGDDGVDASDDGASVDVDVDDDDAGEPTATTPRLAATRPQPTPSSDDSSDRSADSEEGDLLAALGDDDAGDDNVDVDVGVGGDDDDDQPTQGMALADFPAVAAGKGSGFLSPLSTSVTPQQLPSAAPTQALPAPSASRLVAAADEASVDVAEADGFDDGAGSTPARMASAESATRPVPRTTIAAPTAAPARHSLNDDDDGGNSDDFDDGKTRALNVDQALLDRLKRGDVDGRRTEPQAPTPTPPPLGDDVDPSGDDELHAVQTSATLETPLHMAARGAGPAPTAALASGDGEAVMPAPSPDEDSEPRPPAAALDVDVDSSADDGDDGDDGGPVDADDPDADAREAAIAALEQRAEELTAELAAVRERIAALVAERESTATRPVRSGGEPTATRPVRADMLTAPTAAGPTKNTEVRAPLLDAPRAPKPRTGLMPVVDARDADLPSIGQSADDSAEGTDVPPHATGAGTSLPSLASVDLEEVDGAGDAGVSLADLQGVLGDLPAEDDDAPAENAGATQVAASVLPINVENDDGDVFGTSGAGKRSKKAAGDLSEDATRIRVNRPAAIALVVEDAKARDRLRKHLESRYAEVVDAESARAIAQSDDVERVDAIVFVRPSASENNRQGFARLSGLAHRPRVLVISADVSFDGVPGIDLRLPLGQKASEVARQVIDGLSQLGVQAQQA